MLTDFSFATDAFGALVGVLVGLLWAPWSSMLIARPPLRDAPESLGLPFRCSTCRHSLTPRDVIPFASQLLSGGRCRHCSAPIPKIEFINEVSCAGVGGLAGAFTGTRTWLPAMLAVALFLVPISIVDLKSRLIATKLVYPATVIVFVLFALSAFRTGDWRRLGVAVVCGIGSSLFIWILWFVYPKGMGPGDARLSLMLGLGSGWFGWQGAVLGMMFGFLLGNIIGIPYSLIKLRNLKLQLPFGPFLGLGALLLMLFAP
jgi:leader peptidase (prepilin peptidase) / N-methyltransferase